MSSITFSSGAAIALDGLRQADQAMQVALKAVGSGSLDPNVMAQAASILQGAQGQQGANAIALRASLAQQSYFIDILA
ncbi:MAG: hypothetical protein ACK4FK_00495 [Ferrovibrio sp.]|jgi:hypothetical protein|uniref:hypothetical protein n=1 Tax=Ferrovibrio sp. TaxID=1917215 RepID=UPI00391990E9